MAAFRIRQAAAQAYLDEPEPAHRPNGDEERYPDKRASFAKTLPHNDAGEVDVEAFAMFVSVLSRADPQGFETLPRDPRAEVDLNDPQAAYAFDLAGLDGAATRLDPPPTFASALMATEMAELYWLSLTRDVPFREYETEPLVAAAVADMNAFTERLTSGTREKLTPSTVFRGETPGDLIGPYLSQFSPMYPSYPAAHACNAGACATVLKAFFDVDYVLPHAVEAKADGSALDTWRGAGLTLGNEIDKLAGNIALGRDAAGVHFRSDSIRGLFVGEQQAIGLLRDYSRTYNEHFEGFVVRKFDGSG